MYVDFVGNFIQLGREVLDRRLDEKHIRQASLSRIPMYLLRDFFQRPRVRVYPDVKLVWVLASALVYKETVSSPDVDHYPFAGTGR